MKSLTCRYKPSALDMILSCVLAGRRFGATQCNSHHPTACEALHSDLLGLAPRPGSLCHSTVFQRGSIWCQEQSVPLADQELLGLPAMGTGESLGRNSDGCPGRRSLKA